MTTTVRKSSDLAKRVRRFLVRERRRDRDLSKLLECLDARRDLYLFGGVLRDIALYGIDKTESDIDLVWTAPGERLRSVLEENGSDYVQNRFGGFRVETGRWFVDLWRAEDTWAFREGGQEYRGVESLLDTTITNWESVLCRLDGYRVIHRVNYFEELDRRYLDVVFERNPNPLGMYVRIMRTYASRETAMLSPRAARVLGGALERYSYEDMRRYEEEHYRHQYVDEAVYKLFEERVCEAGPRGVELATRPGSLW